MKHIKPREFTGKKAWDELDIANFGGTTVKLHWTDEPYELHVNDGEEVFVVLDGTVEMLCIPPSGEENRFMLSAGDIFHVAEGCKHNAYPQGVARVLVVEREGSI